MSPAPTPTPRTDANCEVWLVTPNVELEDGRPISGNVVEADFARQLERELAEAKAEANAVPLPSMADDFERSLADMPEHEMRRRLLNQRDTIKRWASCLDGLEIPSRCNRGMDGFRASGDVREIASRILQQAGRLAGALMLWEQWQAIREVYIDTDEHEDGLIANRLEERFIEAKDKALAAWKEGWA